MKERKAPLTVVNSFNDIICMHAKSGQIYNIGSLLQLDTAPRVSRVQNALIIAVSINIKRLLWSDSRLENLNPRGQSWLFVTYDT